MPGEIVPFEVDYLTDDVILDMHGGERVSQKDRSLTQPGEILVWDSEGMLRVYNELDDREEYARCVGRLSGSDTGSDTGTGPAPGGRAMERELGF